MKTIAKKMLKDIFIILGLTVFLLILGHFAIGCARYVKHSIYGVKTGDALTEKLKLSPVFKGYQGYDQYFEDVGLCSRMQVLPYYHWRRYPCQGKVIRLNEESIRRTIKSPKPSAKKVFMFGGSTMWGTGSPDAYTIPSQLQALLGDDYDVYNFGEAAFVSTQQLNLLLEQLSKGFIPDIVIFYDGVNDTYASLYSPGKLRHPQFRPEDYTSKSETPYLLLKLIEKTNYIAITERLKFWLKKDELSKWESSIGPNLTLKIGDTLTQYQALMKQVSALGNAYGFSTYHFWQPMLLTEKRTLTDYEQNIYKTQTDILIQSYRVMYDAARKLDGKNHFYFIADVFNKSNQPIYFDFCHVGPKGNELVARKMYELAFNQNQKASQS